ncbi:MAG: hypothetical protein KKB02_08135 [Alphaproteobacteria bacterium]|nr:hypothetical protein [Alphaproteobacteria bacterium]
MTDVKKTDLHDTAATADAQTEKFRKTGQAHADDTPDTSAHVTENMPQGDKDTLKKTMKD